MAKNFLKNFEQATGKITTKEAKQTALYIQVKKTIDRSPELIEYIQTHISNSLTRFANDR
jgi:hypothetical protein